jgi:hypothetical protein
MPGQKEFRPKLFYHLSLEEYVPENHLLRRVLRPSISPSSPC